MIDSYYHVWEGNGDDDLASMVEGAVVSITARQLRKELADHRKVEDAALVEIRRIARHCQRHGTPIHIPFILRLTALGLKIKYKEDKGVE